MTTSKTVIVSILLCFMFVWTRCSSDSATPEVEIEQLKSKITCLETSYLELVDEVRKLEEITLQLENVIRDKSEQIAMLVGEIEVLQKMTMVDEEESMTKAYAHNFVLEKQMERLDNELEAQIKKGESLEIRASGAEKSLQELRHKLECVENIDTRQRLKIQEVSENLQRVEEQLAEVKAEARLKDEELAKIYSSWLPHWLGTYILQCQEFVLTHWNAHVKPAADVFLSKAAEKTAQAQKLVEPHMNTATRVQAAIKEFLSRHEVLKPLAIEWLTWLMTFAAFALPLIVVHRIYSALLRKTTRAKRSAAGDRAAHRPKRRHYVR